MSGLRLRLAAVACVAGGLLWGVPAQAAPVVNADVIRAAADRMSPVTEAQYAYVRYWRGRRYCFYWDGWQGPGWYRCGYEWRHGYGWGGNPGWHGWVYPRARYGRPNYRGPRARPGRPGYRGRPGVRRPGRVGRPGVRSGRGGARPSFQGRRGGARPSMRGASRGGARPSMRGGGRSGARSGGRGGGRSGRGGGRR